MNTTELLEQLSELYALLDVLQLQEQDIIDTLMPPEIMHAMKAVQMEYSCKKLTAMDNIATLEAAAKRAVINSGETVKAAGLQVTYNKGRVSWDNRKLEGLMIAFPRLGEACKQGNPYASIKKIG